MSKFLKFIVHLVIFLAILDVLALAVPPFLGINTTIIDNTGKATNLPVGSVTYAQPVAVDELQVGDSVLRQDGEAVYRYRIHSIDSSSGVFQVYDQTDVEAGETSIALKNTAYKVVITIGYMGYLIIATQTIEGWIIIGLVILFLIILFILSELWRKDKSSKRGKSQAGDIEEMEEPEEDEEPKTKRQLKKEMKRRMKEEEKLDKVRAKQELEEATRQLKEENKARKKDLKKKKKEARKRARTGGFIEDYNPIEAELQEKEAKASSIETAAEEASQLLKEEIAAVTADALAEPEVLSIAPEQAEMGDTRDVVIPKNTEEAVEAETMMQESLAEPEKEELPEVEEVPVEIKKMAIPIYSTEELLSKAQEAGESPKIIRDEKSGVTFLDYSEILFEDE